MARNNQRGGSTSRRAPKDLGRRVKKKPCALCRDKVEWVDYKDVPMLRKYMSDRGKIRSRRVTGNCAQHQRALAQAIKTARELVLLPYTQRTVTERPGGRGGPWRSRAGADQRAAAAIGDGRESPTSTDAQGDPETEAAVVEEAAELVEELAEEAGRGLAGGDGMKVLLRDDVAGVGRRGDIVKVAGGFARNFLLPEGRAIVATDGIEGQAEQMRRGPRPARGPGPRRRRGADRAARRRRDPDQRPGGRRRAALRLHRAGRGGRRHPGGQGRRGGPQARAAARPHQGDGHLRGDRGAVPGRLDRRDGGGHGRRLGRPAIRGGRITASETPVCAIMCSVTSDRCGDRVGPFVHGLSTRRACLHPQVIHTQRGVSHSKFFLTFPSAGRSE